jgi:hypothetical protein
MHCAESRIGEICLPYYRGRPELELSRLTVAEHAHFPHGSRLDDATALGYLGGIFQSLVCQSKFFDGHHCEETGRDIVG